MDLNEKLKKLCYLQTLINMSSSVSVIDKVSISNLHRQAEELTEEIKKIDVKNNDRKGEWVFLASGRRFWIIDPRPEDIYIEDIAHGLSMICRFCGQTRKFYSVSQHSILVSKELQPQYQLGGLLHDASESYIGDIITPVKKIIKNYDELEENIMDCIIKRFNLPSDKNYWREIKKADMVMMATEFRDVARHGTKFGGFHYPPSTNKITQFWEPKKAKQEFLNRFEELCPKNVQISLGLNQDSAADLLLQPNI